jgi:polysaccharide export outer membrane protein|tara:strand:- start:2518 stop:3171 length:654 start_codon:yes stop_codon:yes gene_type:complete
MIRSNFVLSYLERRAIGFLVGLTCLLAIQSLPAEAQGYSIRPGDRLRIEVLEDSSLNRTVLVGPDGRISFPTAGTLPASGRNIEAIQNAITQRLSGNFAVSPNVFVSLEGLAEIPEPAPAPVGPPPTVSIYVIGEAGNTGKLSLEPGTTVLQAFAVMGGFTRFAATKRVQLRRTDPNTNIETVYRLNYDQIEKGSRAGLSVLQEGDVIVVPQRRLFE